MRRRLTATLLAAVVPCLSLAAQRADTLPLKPTRTVDFTTSEGTWISLDVSPDGQTLVFELLGDLYTLPLSGGEAKRITSGPAFDSQPRYSPDGRKIVFLSDRSGSENIWVCDADGANPRPVTKGDKSLYASPEWTPDGDYIVASKTGMPIGSTYEIWLYHKDGGSGTSLTKEDKGPAPGPPGRGAANNALGAAFGPDARYMWYARHRGGFGYNLNFPLWELAIYDRQTGKVFPQTDLYGGAMRPVLSPDGKWLVYATRHDAETGLRLRNLASGDEQWLVYPVQRDDQESRFTRDLMPGSSFTPDSKAEPGIRSRVKRDSWSRSEEHTSELQSQSNLVCRLLLEKKNNIVILVVAIGCDRREKNTYNLESLLHQHNSINVYEQICSWLIASSYR